MNKGKVIFHGTKHEAIIWAAKEGHPAEEFENPADHLTDSSLAYELPRFENIKCLQAVRAVHSGCGTTVRR